MITHFTGNGFKYNQALINEILIKIFTDFNISLVSLNIIQLTDDELKDVNIQFLQHDYYTDIITFNYGSDLYIEGELYISFERALENEKIFHKQNEIIRLIIHGALHLCGLDDNTDKLKEQIHLKEDYYLDMFHVKH
ncbi:MAG: rRNA maturation RNase YbeY [Bacteroidia bacterium]